MINYEKKFLIYINKLQISINNLEIIKLKKLINNFVN